MFRSHGLSSAATETAMSIRTTSIVRKRPALSLSAGIACLAALAAAVTASSGRRHSRRWAGARACSVG